MKSSSVYKPTIRPTINQQWDQLYPNARNYSRHKESHSLRILAAVSAFIKLLESLFWLSLLLEVTHNEEDNSGTTLTIILATAFVISITTGLISMFGPCFHGLIQYQISLIPTVACFIWNIIVLLLTFILDYYKHLGNKDNQAETAFNATIGLITAGAIFATTNKLIAQEKRFQKWNKQKSQFIAKPLV